MKKSGYAELSSGSGSAKATPEQVDFELRPGGMLVQKRDEKNDSVNQGPTIRVRVSHGLESHEIHISSHASFGELKKLLVQPTGLEPKEQRLLYRGKEKESYDYLHLAGVKDKSKILLVEDPASREKRLDEQRNKERIAKQSKTVASISLEVDKLADQLSSVEEAINNGNRVSDNEFETLIEKLMTQVLKLDGIEALGEAKQQRRLQVRRIQRLVESADALRIRNRKPNPADTLGIYSRNPAQQSTKIDSFDGVVSKAQKSRSQPAVVEAIASEWERALSSEWESFD